ncbi:MAG: hypothetical protein Q8S54_15105 [Bacteroidota bacterium]|nr:hypothetical protein [Bacteroidota bacterium]
MQVGLQMKLKAMLWDIPESQRLEIANNILSNPVETFRESDELFIKALNSLKWYELTKLLGKQNLLVLLTDTTIRKLYPVQRRTYYTNARRLLSKHSVSTSGQSA